MGTRITLNWRSLCLVVALVVVASACSTDDSPVAEGIEGVSSTTSAPVESVETGEQEPAEAPTPQEPVIEDPTVPLTTDFGVGDDAIRIGYSLDLSGVSSFDDARLLDGHFARFDQINANGGLAGRSIEVVAMDNQGDPARHAQNLAVLESDGPEAVLAIGGLSQPSVDRASADTLGSTEILLVGHRDFAADLDSPSGFVPVRPTVCVETRVGIAALAASGDGEATQLALLVSGEEWAQTSASHARELAEDLELEIVIDESLDPNDDVEASGELFDDLVNSDAELVWVAGASNFISWGADSLASAEDAPDWTWGGPSANGTSTFGSVTGPALADVYQVTHAGPLVDAESLSGAREALASAAPELSYANAGPALLGWEQAGLIVSALEEGVAAEDLTRASLAGLASSLTSVSSELAVYSIELTSGRDALLADAGSTGLEELFTASDIPATLANPCG